MNLGGELFNSVFSASQVEASRASGPPPEGPPWTIAWAGRMGAEKGLLELLYAFEHLINQGLDARLVLIGDGPERAFVEERSKSLPAGRVHFAGYVGDPDGYLDLLRQAHVLAHPSGAEAVPKVIGEAMAAGVPVVATPVGGVTEILGNGERGRLVPVYDIGELAWAIADLLENPAERGALRDRGLEWAADHTAERQAERLVDWLRGQFPGLPW
jgi:glycosyltransferase involved in cell wall biosynthesis